MRIMTTIENPGDSLKKSISINTTADWEAYFGEPWYLSEEAFETINKFYDSGTRILESWAPELKYWRQLNGLEELIRLYIRTRCSICESLEQYIELCLPDKPGAYWELEHDIIKGLGSDGIIVLQHPTDSYVYFINE